MIWLNNQPERNTVKFITYRDVDFYLILSIVSLLTDQVKRIYLVDVGK